MLVAGLPRLDDVLQDEVQQLRGNGISLRNERAHDVQHEVDHFA